jgi:hypothetical protein
MNMTIHHPQGCVAIHEDSLCTPPTTHLAFHMGMAYNTLARPSEKNKWVTTRQPIHMFDFNQTNLVFLSTMIGIKPITIIEQYFKNLIPDKVILNYVFNDPIVLNFVSLCINDLVTTPILVVAASGREASKMVEWKRNMLTSYQP